MSSTMLDFPWGFCQLLTKSGLGHLGWCSNEPWSGALRRTGVIPRVPTSYLLKKGMRNGPKHPFGCGHGGASMSVD